jgi:hypothetical protein
MRQPRDSDGDTDRCEVGNLQLKLELGKGIIVEEGREEKSRERWRREGEKKKIESRIDSAGVCLEDRQFKWPDLRDSNPGL